MKKLSYIRHGLSEANKKVVFAGHTDTPLSIEGRKQAQLAGIEAAKHDIDHIIVSPLSRAFDTAKIVAETIGFPLHDIEIHELLIERNFGPLELTPWSQELSWTLNHPPYPEGVETIEALLQRSKELLNHIEKSKYQHILLVGHGAIGRAIRSHVAPDVEFEEKIHNAQFLRWK